MKSVLPDIIHTDQNGYIKGMFIGENITLIEDILQETDEEAVVLLIDQGSFSISLLKLSQLKAKSWSQPSSLFQTGFLSCVQVSDLGEILTWDSS